MSPPSLHTGQGVIRRLWGVFWELLTINFGARAPLKAPESVPATGAAVANPQQPGMGLSGYGSQRRADESRANFAQGAARAQRLLQTICFVLCSRSTGPQWMRNAVQGDTSLSRQRFRPLLPVLGVREIIGRGNAGFRLPQTGPDVSSAVAPSSTKNVVLRQMRERSLQENDDPLDDGGDS